jgi:hypothetical protein
MAPRWRVAVFISLTVGVVLACAAALFVLTVVRSPGALHACPPATLVGRPCGWVTESGVTEVGEVDDDDDEVPVDAAAVFWPFTMSALLVAIVGRLLNHDRRVTGAGDVWLAMYVALLVLPTGASFFASSDTLTRTEADVLHVVLVVGAGVGAQLAAEPYRHEYANPAYANLAVGKTRHGAARFPLWAHSAMHMPATWALCVAWPSAGVATVALRAVVLSAAGCVLAYETVGRAMNAVQNGRAAHVRGDLLGCCRGGRATRSLPFKNNPLTHQLVIVQRFAASSAIVRALFVLVTGVAVVCILFRNIDDGDGENRTELSTSWRVALATLSVVAVVCSVSWRRTSTFAPVSSPAVFCAFLAAMWPLALTLFLPLGGVWVATVATFAWAYQCHTWLDENTTAAAVRAFRTLFFVVVAVAGTANGAVAASILVGVVGAVGALGFVHWAFPAPSAFSSSSSSPIAAVRFRGVFVEESRI